MAPAINISRINQPSPERVRFYRTSTEIDNPLGDGRHNRAQWRSYLDKNKIPAGWVFGVDEFGNVYDHSAALKVISKKEATALMPTLMAVAGEPVGGFPTEDTIDTVLSTMDPATVARALIETLNLSAQDLRDLLLTQGVTADPSAVTVTITNDVYPSAPGAPRGPLAQA